MSAKNPLNLTGVPKTMLWTLYNRAREARRPDGFPRDPECVRVYESIDYDYERSFGKPDASHPMRSRVFDDALRPWLQAHPGGTVVELGAGLETQFHRCDDGRVQLFARGLSGALLRLCSRTPGLRNLPPAIVHVKTTGATAHA